MRSTSNAKTGFFDTGDIRRVGLHQSDLNPARLTANDLRSVQGILEVPTLRRNNTATLSEVLEKIMQIECVIGDITKQADKYLQ